MRVTAFVAIAVLLSGCSQSAITPNAPQSSYGAAVVPKSLGVTPFNAPTSVFPGATTTGPTGIRKRYITATVTLTSGATIGGLYDRAKQTWVQIAYPGAQSTAAYGPLSIKGGYIVVGSYKNAGQKGDSGFIYDSVAKQYTPFVAPPTLCAPQACNFTIAHSAFGGKGRYLVVGNYDAAAKAPTIAGHAFLYDSVTKRFATIDIKGAVSTTAYGIWIDKKNMAIAGGYTDKKGRHAYVRDLTGNRLVTYDYPGAALTHFEGITGAGGHGYYNVVGDYTKPRDKTVYGFFLHLQNWRPWPPIVIGKLSANSVSDRDVIGVYNPGGGISGFITTLPVQDPP